MNQKYKDVMNTLFIEENVHEDKLIENIDRTFKIVQSLNDADVDMSVEPLEYLNLNGKYQNKLRNKLENRSNTSHLETNDDNYFVVKK